MSWLKSIKQKQSDIFPKWDNGAIENNQEIILTLYSFEIILIKFFFLEYFFDFCGHLLKVLLK